MMKSCDEKAARYRNYDIIDHGAGRPSGYGYTWACPRHGLGTSIITIAQIVTCSKEKSTAVSTAQAVIELVFSQ
jgi:hypothetical protein